MLYSIRFGTFNIGQGINDYSFMLRGNGRKEYKRLEEQLDEAAKEIAEKYPLEQRGEEETRKKITNKCVDKAIKKIERSVAEGLSDQCDVIALQEVANLNRPFIKKLQEKGFKIYHIDISDSKSRFSTAIALKENVFDSHVKNISILSESGSGSKKKIYGQEIAAVVTKIRNSDLEIAFSSMHSWGFQLYSPKQTKRYEEEDVQSVRNGIAYTREALDNLGERFPAVIGGDMNNNPDNQPAQFELIERREFEILEPNLETNINRLDADEDYQNRKIDFIFVSKPSSMMQRTLMQRICSAISRVFVSGVSLTSTPAKVLEGFDFTVEGNCSDHKPVVTQLTMTRTPSVISRIYHCVLHCLGLGK